MLIEDRDVREKLERIITSLTSNAALRADLRQEALIRLWQTQLQEPAQTRTWYLQNCRYHLLHYLALGRSVDSPKRRAAQVHAPLRDQQQDEQEDWMDQFEAKSSPLQDVHARDILSLLSQVLTPREISILRWLVEGLGTREIARQLSISHPMVIKLRRKIAGLAAKLSIGKETFRGTKTTR